jgi:hypothetical protein
VNASARQLEDIGVFGAKQHYAIQFSHEAAVTPAARQGAGVAPEV